MALITGGANGIGAACARRLGRSGAAVIVADIDDDAANKLVQELTTDGVDALYQHADASARDAWDQLADLVRRRHGRLDILVSNAYVLEVAPAHELEEHSWDRQLAVNVKPLYLAAATLIDLLRHSGGSIVAISSVHAGFGFPGHPAYDASKGAIVSLARQLAVEYGPHVRVNTVVPGPILTARTWASADEREQGRAAAETVLGRMGDPDEVAAVVEFLASNDASYITGACVPVDGGWSAGKQSP